MIASSESDVALVPNDYADIGIIILIRSSLC